MSAREVRLKKGVPVVLELTSLDVAHGFNLPDLGVRADVLPGLTTSVRIVPQQAGRFVFHCDIFCGTGHEELEGTIVVTE
jgi:cytochrome c oxidase subunit 2